MISRRTLIFILLIISWPVNNIHRLLNNYPETWGHWFLFDPACSEELQWHVHTICECISYLCIFIGIRLYISQLKNRKWAIDAIINCILIVQGMDLIHYLGWHRRSEIILTIEGLVFIITTFVILKKSHGQAH